MRISDWSSDVCSSDLSEVAAPSGVSTLEVTLKDFAFDPDDLRVDAGAVLNLTNEGSVAHNLAVDGTASDMIEAGEGGTLDLADVEPGTYTIICEVPGHEAAGLRGTLVVERSEENTSELQSLRRISYAVFS